MTSLGAHTPPQHSAPSSQRETRGSKLASILIVKWVVKASEVARIRDLLPDLAAKTRAEEGNLFYAIYQSDVDPKVFILREGYADTDAVAAHRNSEHYQSIVAKQIVPHLESREVINVTQLL